MTRARPIHRPPLRAVLVALVLGLAGGLALPVVLAAPARAHVERPSYFPNPRADCSVDPCAGGKVPSERSLVSALDASRPGRTRVVCQDDSLDRLRASVAAARRSGYYDRPTVHSSLSDARANMLLRVNKAFFRRCSFQSIQAAVNASGNNDRVVVMPGLYLEQHSRKQPTHDPACAKYTIKSDSGDPGALSHDYQIHCPNDANLVAVIGRGPDTAPPPSPPRTDRHGIPHAGRCIRCNLQLEGSGVSADDVVVEAGDASAGNSGPSAVGNAKDVVMFIDRADGFVLRNLTVRHAREHDIYILETDGYRFNRFKAFYAGGYGVLTFVEDHGVIENCEAAGNGDSGIYPGSGPEGHCQRYGIEIRNVNSHHNTIGYSGTAGNGVWMHDSKLHHNSTGMTTDSFASGHPGMPQDCAKWENNQIYSNNEDYFNDERDAYCKNTPTDKRDPTIVCPTFQVPVGTGIGIFGGNGDIARNNYIYDNWRDGIKLLYVPAAFRGEPDKGRDTSFDNTFTGNKMGVRPDGTPDANGNDFWWDEEGRGNCWGDNTSHSGLKPSSNVVVGLPACPGSDTERPGNQAKLASQASCATWDPYENPDPAGCDWFTRPPEPPDDSSGTNGAAPGGGRGSEPGSGGSGGPTLPSLP